MDNETYLTYVLVSFPQEEYHTKSLVLKDKLRKRTLKPLETENLLMIHMAP